MSIFLLVVIYLIFISLGLPDSIIGTSWPSLANTFGVSESFQGILTSLISLCTIISAFFAPKIIKRLKTGLTVTLSIILTVIGLLIFSFAPNFYVLILACFPLGLGAGAIDTALNNFVALHYKAIHMNWLHSFWGVGATISPLIISSFLTTSDEGWRKGIIVLAIIQGVIFITSLSILPVWNTCYKIFEEREKKDNVETEEKAELPLLKAFKIRGVWFALLGFFSYICVESITGMWFSSMTHYGLNVSEQLSTQWASYFYLGITIGRFIAGILSLKISEKNMIRIGESILTIGVILLFMNFNIYILPVGLVLVGLGCAPIYPAILKATPSRFMAKYSENVISIQMVFAYIANLVVAPLFGVIAKATTFLILPYVIGFFLILLILSNEAIAIKVKKEPIFEIK